MLEGGVSPGQPIVSAVTEDAVPIFTFTAAPGRYYVRVRGVGPGGQSAPSGEILVQVGEAVAPSAPAHLLGTVDGTAVHLAWTPTFDGGVAGGFVLDVSGPVSGSAPLPPGERASFAEVAPGTYTLQVRAVNAAGSSAVSAPVTLTVPTVPAACTAPHQAPQNVLAYRRGTTASLLWDPPAAGAAPSGYEVAVAGYAPFTTTERSLSGLLSAGTYVITVRAVGPCGPGDPAPPVTLVVP